MRTNRFHAILLLAASVSLCAADKSKTTSKPAVAAKPPATAKPAAGAPGRATAGRGTPASNGRGAQPAAAGRGMPAAGRGGAAEARGRGAANPINSRPRPGERDVARGDTHARVDARGRVSELHRPGMDLHRGPNGIRSGEIRRADGARVYMHGRDGYVSRSYAFRGHEFAHRTYYVHGRPYDRFYRGYDYHGVVLEAYAPVRYYPAAYYGWVYNPWVAPVPYTWAWVGNPWALYYGAYFTPYPVYPSASLWLTDYLISASLAAEYQAQLDAANGVAPQPFATPLTPLSPDVKAAIAQEVQRQVALENAEAQQAAQGGDPDPASSSIVRSFQDGQPHVFVVGRDVTGADPDGNSCALSQGDVVQTSGAPPAGSTVAYVAVRASRPQECPMTRTVAIQLVDLQEMQNHMRETIGEGMGDMQTHAGQGGFPAIPASAKGAQFTSSFAANAPPPEPNVGSAIAQQTQEADKAEQEAVAPAPAQPPVQVPAIPAPAAPPPTISKGMTTDQVTSLLGQPKTILELGPTKKIYVYKEEKLTFGADGKVSGIDVQ